ncbi:MAG: pyruvate carboxylase subunit B [Planctomycetes bacterium]|nr:pyruvate carboxylase subunit B [Planctomycetota bacterium]
MAKIKICDLVLRDAHQSLMATRMLTSDMLPITDKLDKVGYWALECWGGATFDTCIRFLNEDPWERLRKLKAALPNTPLMMLLRGQNLLGYRHYADDVVEKFVEKAAENGVDIFRIFDALNDPRNLQKSVECVKKANKHAQGAISYATSPFHTIDVYVNHAKSYKELGVDSICIKDMAGILSPYTAYELTKRLKKEVGLPIHIHSHSTPGMSVATLTKAVEGGADILDTAIAAMAMGTSHSPTETMVKILSETEHDTGLDIKLLAEISAYFRDVKKHYETYLSAFTGAEPRILIAQIPGGMLSNLESQLKNFNATDRLDEVLKEVPQVQKDFGYIPLVTPTSQIVGTQAVFNVMMGKYNQLTQQSKDLLIGKYGKTPAERNPELVARALKEMNLKECETGRPADKIPNEFDKMTEDLKKIMNVDEVSTEDVITYAMFPQVAPNFFKTRPSGPLSWQDLAAKKVAIEPVADDEPWECAII